MDKIETKPLWQQSQLLPPEFDPVFYRKHYSDLGALRDEDLRQHYKTHGVTEGRQASPHATRAGFFGLIAAWDSVLEIGPFANPSVKGANVKYFDVLADQQLRQRAANLGLNADNCPPISYCSSTGDLGIVDAEFDVVVSSHSIEHQPDLISHLLGVNRILRPGGRYFLAIPDKRFCFDHFIAESNVAEVLAAHAKEMRTHDIASVIEHRALIAHNDSVRHWHGDHGEPFYKSNPDSLRSAANEFWLADGGYVDVHAWQFTPKSFADIITCLFELRVMPLRVTRTYPTLRGASEFFAILEKTRRAPLSLRESLPDDFDPDLYLQANPDVKAAGADPRLHYLAFGKREKRKLRP